MQTIATFTVGAVSRTSIEITVHNQKGEKAGYYILAINETANIMVPDRCDGQREVKLKLRSIAQWPDDEPKKGELISRDHYPSEFVANVFLDGAGAAYVSRGSKFLLKTREVLFLREK